MSQTLKVWYKSKTKEYTLFQRRKTSIFTSLHFPLVHYAKTTNYLTHHCPSVLCTCQTINKAKTMKTWLNLAICFFLTCNQTLLTERHIGRSSDQLQQEPDLSTSNTRYQSKHFTPVVFNQVFLTPRGVLAVSETILIIMNVRGMLNILLCTEAPPSPPSTFMHTQNKGLCGATCQQC